MVEYASEPNLLARQAIFGLIGDIQSCVRDHRGVFLPELVKHITANLEFDTSNMSIAGFSNQSQLMQDYGSSQHNAIAVCTNACWALGEIAMTSTQSEAGAPQRQALQAHLPQISQKLVKLLSKQKLNRSLAQNLACTMGRVALASPGCINDAQLQAIMKQWCVSLRFVKDADERESAYRGFCSVLPVSIKAVTDNFPFLCSAISCYK